MLKREMWYAELYQWIKDGKPCEVHVSCVGRIVDGVMAPHITPLAAPEDVRESLCLTEATGTTSQNNGVPLDVDFRKWKKDVKSGKDHFWKTFDFKTSRKYGILRRATGTFEVVSTQSYREHPSVFEKAVRDLQERALSELHVRFPTTVDDAHAAKYKRRKKKPPVYDEVTTKARQALMTAAGVALVSWGTHQYDVRYCSLCGNVRSADRTPCVVCQAELNGRLSRAWEIYQTLQQEHRQCCGGLDHYRDHFHYHGDGWDGTYPEDAPDGERTWCEMGVTLHVDHADTYWIYDDDSTTMSESYGDSISYADPEFWVKLMAQLDEAPEVAWNSDTLTCKHCGYHYHIGCEPYCGCSGSREEQGLEDDEDEDD